MKEKISCNRLGLTLGIFFALLHAIWAILVAVGIASNLVDWILPLHFLNVIYSVTEFSILTALMLVVLAFIGGYVSGWILAEIWNRVKK